MSLEWDIYCNHTENGLGQNATYLNLGNILRYVALVRNMCMMYITHRALVKAWFAETGI